MKYTSTRGKASITSSKAVLKGISDDGGLFVLDNIDSIEFDWKKCLSLNSYQKAGMIISTLLPDYMNGEELAIKAYKERFKDEVITPVSKVGDNYILELYHGPTSAFKDVALSLLPHLITEGKKINNDDDEIVVLTATSGDTGTAALSGFMNVDKTRIIVFYPQSGVSAVQKKQMVSQQGDNVTVCAIKGNFDDCQSGVKSTFARINSSNILENHKVKLSSANSINIGRLVPQIVYYFISYSTLVDNGEIKLGDMVDFSVPTGNFGDILAGYYAKLLGLPIGKLICASNANKVLTDFIASGIYDKRREFLQTSSPSMDILISSNLERLLYLACNKDSEIVKKYMNDLNSNGVYQINKNQLDYIQKNFVGYCCDKQDTLKTIKEVWEKYNYLIDPHTAVGYYGAIQYHKDHESNNKMIILSTASPYKFSSTVNQALGIDNDDNEFEKMKKLSQYTKTPIPTNLAELENKEVLHTDVIEPDQIYDYVLSKLNIKG